MNISYGGFQERALNKQMLFCVMVGALMILAHFLVSEWLK
jgi:hypothetical protein